jgi:hypothetical protein
LPDISVSASLPLWLRFDFMRRCLARFFVSAALFIRCVRCGLPLILGRLRTRSLVVREDVQPFADEILDGDQFTTFSLGAKR